jgi:hypothetical protein
MENSAHVRSLNWANRLLRRRPAFSEGVRIIQTVGCMAADGPTEPGIIINRLFRAVYGSGNKGTNIEFYVVRLLYGKIREFPVQDGFRAQDGVLEFRE